MDYSTADRKAFKLKTANSAPLDEEEVMEPDNGDEDEPVNPQRKSTVAGGQKETGKKTKRPDGPGFKDPAAHEAHELDKEYQRQRELHHSFVCP
jgi:hypothetical protein